MGNTPNLNIPMPDPAADVDDEFYRLQQAWLLIDAILFQLMASVADKSSLGHTHSMDQIAGLATALSGKMPANKTFKIADLTDVIGSAEAAFNYVLAKNAEGKFVFASALSLLGNHEHTVAQVQGLSDALDARLLKAGGTLTGRLTLLASSAAGAGLQLPHGAAPTTPINGELWTTTAALVARINGVSRTMWDSTNAAVISQAEAEALAATTARIWTALRVGQAIAAAPVNAATQAVLDAKVGKATDKATAADITAGVADKFPDAAAVKAGIIANSPLPFTTESTPATNTVLQNTSGKPLFVAVSRTASYFAGGATVIASISTGSLSTNMTKKVSSTIYGTNDNGIREAFVSYIVPPGYYYNLVHSRSGNATGDAVIASAVN